MRSGKAVGLNDVIPISWGGDEAARFLLRAEDTGGLYSFYEVTVPAGGGSLLHIHEDTDEAIFIIEGRFEIEVGGHTHQAPAGVLVYGPRGVSHSFLNTSDKPGKMLCTTTPGGIEKFFEELSQLLTEDPPPEWARIQELGRRNHIVAFPPQGGPPGVARSTNSGHLIKETD
jgi:mannose-6-phosphate isomerase-like protein (cupin superfamily)